MGACLQLMLEDIRPQYRHVRYETGRLEKAGVAASQQGARQRAPWVGAHPPPIAGAALPGMQLVFEQFVFLRLSYNFDNQFFPRVVR